jgi:hypothetical protein
MIHRTAEARWRHLEAHAHLPEVQDRIRQEIRNGAIRVRPRPGGGIRIVPNHGGDDSRASQVRALPTDDWSSALRGPLTQHSPR